MQAHLSDDPAHVLDVAGEFLERDPVAHNLVLTLLHLRLAEPEAGRYAWVSDGGAVVGVMFQSPLTFTVALTPMPGEAAVTLADALAEVPPDLPGVNGEAATTSAFAGAWATRTRAPAAPVEGMRLYCCERLEEPSRVEGRVRRATEDDIELVAAWSEAFHAETGAGAGPPPADRIAAARIAMRSRDLWLWEDGEGATVCMVGVVPPRHGVGRIGPVYTPPEHRGRGYAAALTAHGTRLIHDGGNTAILYTQLSNPTSNAVYQRLGYAPVSELVRYDFG